MIPFEAKFRRLSARFGYKTKFLIKNRKYFVDGVLSIEKWRSFFNHAHYLSRNRRILSEVHYATAAANLFFQYFLTDLWRVSSSSCDFCGEPERDVCYVNQVNTVVRCRACGLEFVDRIPVGGIDVYFDFFGDNPHPEALMEVFWSNPEWQKGRHTMLKEFIGDVDGASNPRALEIGCGSGEQLAIVRDAMGWQVVGTEIGSKLVERGRRLYGLDLRTSTLEDLEFINGEFDAILAFHVLEHLKHPSLLFLKARRWLKPKGRLVIEIPAAVLKDCTPAQRRSGIHGYFNIHHTHFFSNGTFTNYCEKFGFKIIRTNVCYGSDGLLIRGYCCEVLQEQNS